MLLVAGSGPTDRDGNAAAVEPRTDCLSLLAGRLSGPLTVAHEAILAGLEAGRTTDAVPPELHALYRPSVQPYLVSWLRRRPLDAVVALQVPLLVVQGAADAQVDVEDGRLLARSLRDVGWPPRALLRARRPSPLNRRSPRSPAPPGWRSHGSRNRPHPVVRRSREPRRGDRWRAFASASFHRAVRPHRG